MKFTTRFWVIFEQLSIVHILFRQQFGRDKVFRVAAGCSYLFKANRFMTADSMLTA